MTAGNEPIFVVGVARSGTTLLASMMGAHPRLDAGPESRFFFGLERAPVGRILRDPDWPDEAVRFIGSLVTNREPTHEFFGLTLDDVRAYLASRPPSVPVLLESLTVPHAERAGKPRWVEKTTDHLIHVDDLRRHWPEAPIVRIVRDPRDVSLSLRHVPFGSPSVVTNLFFWADRDTRSAAFFERDAHSLTVRYEDLVRDPRAVLTRICEFVGEAFDERMLVTGESARLVAGEGETWKEKARTAVDASRVEAWRHELTPGQQQVAAVVCADGLARYGYPDAVTDARTVVLQPLSRDFTDAEGAAIVEALTERRLQPTPWAADCGVGRTGRAAGREARDAPMLFWGAPGQHRWRWPGGRAARIPALARLVASLARARRRRRAALWVAEPTSLVRKGGAVDRAADLSVWLFARRIAPERAPDELARR